MYKFLAGILSIFFAYFKGSQAATNKIKAQSEEAAREYERAGYEAGLDGMKREQEELKKPIDTEKRDYFE